MKTKCGDFNGTYGAGTCTGEQYAGKGKKV